MLGRLETTVHKIPEKQGLPADTKWKQQPHVPTSRRHKTASGEREDPLSFYRKVATQKKRKRESGSRVKMTFQKDLQPLEGKRAITYQVHVTPRPLPNPYVTVL